MAEKLDIGLIIKAGVEGLNKIDALIDGIDKAGGETEQLREQAADLRKNWQNLGADEQAKRLHSLGNAANQSAKDMGLLGKASEKTSGVFSRMRGVVVGVGAAIAAAFTAGKIKSFFTSAVSGAASLEAQLSTVKAVSGATDEQMRAIADSAEQLGATTKYTATEAAQGFEILARAGLDTQQSLTAIPAVLDLAQAAGIGLADAAGFITKSVAGMNLQMSQSGHVADVLAKAAASANTDVAGLGQALSYAAPTANSLGVSLEDTVAIIGKFADAGIDASRAGTALNSIMAQFSNPASKFRQELLGIGITTDDFSEALRQLEASGASGAEAINAVGLEAGPALKALLAQGMGSVDELSRKLKDADGAASEMAQTMNDNLPGAVKGLSSAWDTLKNNLGKPLLEPLKEQVNKLSEVFRAWVADGTVANLGEKIAASFEALIKYGGEAVKIGAALVATKVSMAAYSVAMNITTIATSAYAAVATKAALATQALNKAIKRNVIGAILTGAVYLVSKGLENLASNVEAVRKSFAHANRTWADAEIAQNRINAAISAGIEHNKAYVTEQQALIEQELKNIDGRLKKYREQISIAEERSSVDHKTIAAAKEAIAAEEARKQSLEATAEAAKQAIEAHEAEIKAAQEAQAAREASQKGWDLLSGSMDKATEKALEFPKRSQEVIDALSELSKNADETGENLKLAFSVGIADIETQEALDVVKAQLRELAKQGRITGDDLIAVQDLIAQKYQELPARVSEATVALDKLGLSAKELQTGISQSADAAINLFSTAAQSFANDAEQMARIYNAALAKMDSPEAVAALDKAMESVSAGGDVAVDTIKALAQELRATKGEADGVSEAFKTLGLDAERLRTGISDSAQKSATAWTTAFSSLETKSQQTAQAVQAAFDNSVSGLETVQEFKLLHQALKDTGTLSQLTAEQMAVLKAGMEGGTEAVREHTEALLMKNTATDNATEAVKKYTVATAQSKAKTAENTAETKKATEAKKEATTATYQLYDATNLNAEAIDKLNQKTKVWQNVFNRAARSGHIALIDQANRLNTEIQEFAQATRNAQNATAALNDKISDGTVTMQDIQIATRDAKVGIYDLDNATLNNLNAAIDAARQKIADMRQEAEDTRAAIEAQLASLKGDDSKAAALEQEKKLRELNAKLQEAELARNNQATAQYQQAIELQKQLYSEQRKQASERKQQEIARKAEQEKRQKARTNTPSRRSSNQASQSVNTGTLQKDINQAVTAGISQADLSGLVKSLGENAGKALIEQMRQEAKRLPR